MSMIVRPAGKEDLPIIQHLAHLIWPAAYWNILSSEQMGYMLEKMYNLTVLEHQLLEESHQFFIAENGQPIGFAGASPYDYHIADQPNAVFWKLHKLYVLPHVQKSGAGKTLLQQVIAAAKNNGATTLLLNVNRNNNAYQYYLSHGFKVVETGDFDIGAGFYMNDYVMAKHI